MGGRSTTLSSLVGLEVARDILGALDLTTHPNSLHKIPCENLKRPWPELKKGVLNTHTATSGSSPVPPLMRTSHF